ncbi:sugar phosphate isomerase/epimerase [Gammaproteobacteria bacterium]|nr:sugar phosphate isomerase/epimerase [Gammaproteobacteria bacterium]
MIKVNISTGGERNKTAYETASSLIEIGIHNIELSGGLYDPNQLKNLSKLKDFAQFYIHNYFPPPSEAFVMNLASLDQDIAKLTIEHIKRAIRLSSKFESNVYSFHAGFLIDLKPDELGKRVVSRSLVNRDNAMFKFIERLNLLDNYAQSHGVKLLIENNVLSKNNLHEFKCDPFLMANSSDSQEIMSNTSDNVGMLLDVAHLKVSANSLGYNPVDFLQAHDKWIEAYHLSDNDGTKDNNQIVEKDSWFWPYLKHDIDFVTLEVYNCSLKQLLNQHRLVNNLLGNYK